MQATRPLSSLQMIPPARRYAAIPGRQRRLCAQEEWVEPPDQGVTPLYQAVKDCNLDLVKSILTSGEVTHINAWTHGSGGGPYTPLHLAARGGRHSERPHLEYLKIMDVLLAHVADPYACHPDVDMPLSYAANNGRPWSDAAVELLLSHGMDINAKDPWGYTCLFNAAPICQVDIAEVLLAHGADPNITPEHAFTALHHAACQEDAELCQLLVSHGADIAARDSKGYTPCWWATLFGAGAVMEIVCPPSTETS